MNEKTVTITLTQREWIDLQDALQKAADDAPTWKETRKYWDAIDILKKDVTFNE